MLNRYDASRRCNTADNYSNILRIFYKRTLKNKSKNLSPSPKLLNFAQPEKGKMPEWSIGTVSKTVVPLRVPRVRIPVFPPTTKGCKSNDAQPFVVRKGGMRTLAGFVIAKRFRSAAEKESLSFRQRRKAASQTTRGLLSLAERVPGFLSQSLQISYFDGTVISSVEVF